jgi:hypothetical protein
VSSRSTWLYGVEGPCHEAFALAVQSACPPASTDFVSFLISTLSPMQLLVSAASPGLKLVRFVDFLEHNYVLFEKYSMHVQNALIRCVFS